MIDFIIRQLFKWNALRIAIFEEVDWQNGLGLILNDPEAMKTATAMWYDTDGWRGWTIKDNNNYYFHDIPENNFSDIMYILNEKDLI